MDLSSLQNGIWLIPWPWWWVMIGLAVGFILLLGWAGLSIAKQADKHIEVYDREFRRKISELNEVERKR